MNQDLFNYYYESGYMPDRYYYQLNGKSAQENYRDMQNKRFNIKKKKSSLEDIVFNLMRACLDTALKEIMQEIIPPK